MAELQMSAIPVIGESAGALIGYFLDEENRYRGIFWYGAAGFFLGVLIDAARPKE